MLPAVVHLKATSSRHQLVFSPIYLFPLHCSFSTSPRQLKRHLGGSWTSTARYPPLVVWCICTCTHPLHQDKPSQVRPGRVSAAFVRPAPSHLSAIHACVCRRTHEFWKIELLPFDSLSDCRTPSSRPALFAHNSCAPPSRAFGLSRLGASVYAWLTSPTATFSGPVLLLPSAHLPQTRLLWLIA